MATIKVKFRPSVEPGNEGTIYYQIYHRHKVRQLVTDLHLTTSEWHQANTSAKTTDSGYSRITNVHNNIIFDKERLIRIIHSLESTLQTFSAADIVCEFISYTQKFTLKIFMENIITKLRINGKIRTAETYHATLRSFTAFRQGKDTMIDHITSDIMEAYQSWLIARGVVPNTVSFYARILRAVYNRAIEQNATPDRHPFRHIYTRVDKTVKRALPLSAIRKIKALKLDHSPKLDLARDMFLMSFYLRGMSFIDMAFLRKSDLSCGHITYRRRKTGQLLTIAWTREMHQILSKYPHNPTSYLLPIIRSINANERSCYRNMGYNINHNLKSVANMAGLNIPLTMYVARHSWASAAKAKGIPLNVISQGMGHDSETTTQIYLASLDTTVVDKANAVILASL